jgi:hypothetical protein
LLLFFIFLVFPCFILLFVLVICAFFNICMFLMELSLLIKNLNSYKNLLVQLLHYCFYALLIRIYSYNYCTIVSTLLIRIYSYNYCMIVCMLFL